MQQVQSTVSPSDGVFFADYCARILPVFSVNTGLYFLGRSISPFVSVLHKHTTTLIISQPLGSGYFLKNADAVVLVFVCRH